MHACTDHSGLGGVFDAEEDWSKLSQPSAVHSRNTLHILLLSSKAERQRQRDRHTQRERQRDRERERQKARQRQKETQRQREKSEKEMESEELRPQHLNEIKTFVVTHGHESILFAKCKRFSQVQRIKTTLIGTARKKDIHKEKPILSSQ